MLIGVSTSQSVSEIIPLNRSQFLFLANAQNQFWLSSTMHDKLTAITESYEFSKKLLIFKEFGVQ